MADSLSMLSGHYEQIAAVIIFVIGLMNLLLQDNLIKVIIGFNMMDAAVFLFLAAGGYIEGRTAPIVIDGITDTSMYINPVPAGLVLTGIVVSVSFSAVLMGITIGLYRRFHTLNLNEIMIRIHQLEIDEAFSVHTSEAGTGEPGAGGGER